MLFAFLTTGGKRPTLTSKTEKGLGNSPPVCQLQSAICDLKGTGDLRTSRPPHFDSRMLYAFLAGSSSPVLSHLDQHCPTPLAASLLVCERTRA
jgi:hypothetical protein